MGCAHTVGQIPRQLAKLQILRLPQYAEKSIRGKSKVPRERKYTFCDSWGGFVFGADKQSVVSSSGLVRYFVHNLWYWFVIYLYSGSLIY